MAANERVYPSKKGFVIYIPLLLIIVVEAVYISTGLYWGAVLLMLIMGVSYIPMLVNTRYTIINDETLKIKCGLFLNQTVEIKSIRKIEDTRTVLSSPALSLDRIEIFYNKFDSIIVSPENKTDFVAELQSLNPAIEYRDKQKS
jgi:hypothetical protein